MRKGCTLSLIKIWALLFYVSCDNGGHNEYINLQNEMIILPFLSD